MEDKLYIDIEAIIKSKSERLYRLTPSFVVNYLKRIVHQDEMNEAFSLYGHLQGVEFIHAVFDYLDIKYSSTGLENIPADGRYLFASNHPFGGMDGMMLVDEIASHLGSTKVVVNDLLMNVKPLHSVFIPINKHGGQSRVALKAFREAMDSDVTMATFPSGMCSRMIDGKVNDLEWKTSFVKDAIKSKRDIVPVYFEGGLSKFFYRLYKIRKACGIKFNIEMLYLVDEMFKQKGARLGIHFGAVIPYEQFAQTKDLRSTAEFVREKVYQMRTNK